MHIFDINEEVYFGDKIGRIIDVFVSTEDNNTRYLVELFNKEVITVLAKDLELAKGKGGKLYTNDYVEKTLLDLKERVEKLEKKPKLVIIKANNDKASERYVANKIKRCEKVGMISEIVEFREEVTQEEVENVIEKLNNDDECTAMLLQLPLYPHLDEFYLTNKIHHLKDADGFCIYNSGLLALGRKGNVACTPAGIIDFLLYNNVELKGKDVVIVNASNVVGKPLANLFLQYNATPTICHKETKNVKEKIKNADIVILATGNANFVGVEDFVKGQIVIDVSINFVDGKMCGDINKADYQALIDKGVFYTIVPNGVGQLTTLTLIKQTVEIAERREKNGE